MREVVTLIVAAGFISAALIGAYLVADYIARMLT